MGKAAPVRVFISYSHDSPEHKSRVLQLADRLRSGGVESHIDQYVHPPPLNWSRWMMDSIEEADFVLVVCSETYNRRFRGKEVSGKGKGTDWEGAIITQEIYDAKSRTHKFIPVVFDCKEIFPTGLMDSQPPIFRMGVSTWTGRLVLSVLALSLPAMSLPALSLPAMSLSNGRMVERVPARPVVVLGSSPTPIRPHALLSSLSATRPTFEICEQIRLHPVLTMRFFTFRVANKLRRNCEENQESLIHHPLQHIHRCEQIPLSWSKSHNPIGNRY